MGNILTERDEMVEAMLWLKGERIRIKRGASSVTCTIEEAREGSLLSDDKTSHFHGIELKTDKGEIPLKIPRLIEEHPNGFILDYSSSYNPKSEEEKAKEAEEDDQRFYEFLRKGKGHHFHGGSGTKAAPIEITVLD